MHKFDARSLFLFASLTLGSSAAVLAQTPSQAVIGPTAAPQKSQASSSARAAFDRADLNKDGQLSPAEAQNLPSVAEQFKQVDTDNNGQLSLQEFVHAVESK